MRGTWMADHQRPPSETKRISSNDREVRRIRKLESAHGIEPDNANPVRDQRVFPSLGC
jgi:hypothetical protein